MSYHYTYKLILPETNQYYIGVRTSKVKPEDDKYMGSMKSWKVDRNLLTKHIYKEFDNREDANEWEQLAIITCIYDELNMNAHIPGIGFSTYGTKHTEEHKLKISEAGKGRVTSEETRKKISKSLKGRVFSKEHIEKTAEFNRGKKHTDEHKKKISEGGLGMKRSYETREKISKARIGKKLSEEAKAKIGKANKGRVRTEEEKSKFIESLKGRKWFSNGLVTILGFPGNEPDGFIPGRKIIKNN